MKFIFNFLNLIIFLNVYSFYSNFVLSIEVLLLFIFIFIISNLFYFLYNVLNNFVILKKDEVLKEYYSSLFDFFNLLVIFKNKLFFFKKILIKFYNYLKYILFFFKEKYIKKFIRLQNFYFYIFNNILNSNYLYSLIIKKKLINNFFNVKKLYFSLLKFYNNAFISKDLNSLLVSNNISLSLIFFWLSKKK